MFLALLNEANTSHTLLSIGLVSAIPSAILLLRRRLFSVLVERGVEEEQYLLLRILHTAGEEAVHVSAYHFRQEVWNTHASISSILLRGWLLLVAVTSLLLLIPSLVSIPNLS
jgi:hypothetical protein